MSDVGEPVRFYLGDIGLCLLGTELGQMVAKQYPLDATKFVLEAGCGSGKFGIYYAGTYRCNTTLFDVDPEMVLSARRLLQVVEALTGFRFPAYVHQGDIMHIPYPDDRFDLVFNEGVVEHWLGDERVKCLSEMVRVSRECVAVITNDVEGERSRQRALETRHNYKGMPEYEAPYSKADLTLALEHVGLTNVKVEKCSIRDTQEYLVGFGWKG